MMGITLTTVISPGADPGGGGPGGQDPSFLGDPQTS